MPVPDQAVVLSTADELQVTPVSLDEADSILALAATAAHRSGDRASAPVVAFLAGVAAGGGKDRLAVLAHARHRIETIMAPPGDAGEAEV